MSEKQLLTVDLEDDVVVITIGRKALMQSLTEDPTWPTHSSGRALQVVEPEQFLEELCTRLMDEDMDGNTPVHTAFMAAAHDVINSGTDTVENPDSLGSTGFTADDEELDEEQEFDNDGYNHSDWN